MPSDDNIFYNHPDNSYLNRFINFFNRRRNNRNRIILQNDDNDNNDDDINPQPNINPRPNIIRRSNEYNYFDDPNSNFNRIVRQQNLPISFNTRSRNPNLARNELHADRVKNIENIYADKIDSLKRELNNTLLRYQDNREAVKRLNNEFELKKKKLLLDRDNEIK